MADERADQLVVEVIGASTPSTLRANQMVAELLGKSTSTPHVDQLVVEILGVIVLPSEHHSDEDWFTL